MCWSVLLGCPWWWKYELHGWKVQTWIPCKLVIPALIIFGKIRKWVFPEIKCDGITSLHGIHVWIFLETNIKISWDLGSIFHCYLCVLCHFVKIKITNVTHIFSNLPDIFCITDTLLSILGRTVMKTEECWPDDRCQMRFHVSWNWFTDFIQVS